eukprot:gnl/TRDRNA2_/TRDRNA2_94340_c0_seq1.p1 gnl/TRDRNA2_/TRDRNA2_94340_c0~~gnl/TRDRNA2_/TRDRNA2_94340_c0_seq1.p1  ORF type:complete len:148 (-),score=43.31 gnl/TRDRNA2_/TRDRNA2_94340_c0_seq1:283-726(-)
MKSRWDQLGSEYAGNPNVLIGDVDCTVEEELCKRFDIGGYPTLKYFTPETGNMGVKYTGDRFIEDLQAFAKTLETRACSVDKLDLCSEKEQDYVKKMQAKGADAADKELKRLKGMNAADMSPDKLSWRDARIKLLAQLAAKTGSQEL